MRRRGTIFLLICTAIFSSCEKFDLSVEKDTKENEVTADDKEQVQEKVVNMIDTITPYSCEDIMYGDIADMFNEDPDLNEVKSIAIEGHIVGYVNGNSVLSSAVFDVGNKETNILISDNMMSQDPIECIPIQLSKTSKCEDVRNALNLSANPNMLHNRVVVYGNLVRNYLGTIGLKNVTEYKITSYYFPFSSSDD